MAEPPILIRKYGNLLNVGSRVGPIPAAIVAYFEQHCAYNHVTLIRKGRGFGPTDQRVSTERCRLFSFGQSIEGYPVIVTGGGYLPRIAMMLQHLGVEYSFEDLTPPPKRADCYKQDWDRVLARFPMRPGQLETLQAMASNPGGLIHAAAGFGKTWLFEPMCHLFPNARIDIWVKQADVQQAIRTKLLGSIPNVGKFGGPGKDGKGDRVTVYLNASGHKADGNADIVLADEVHALMAQKSAEVFVRTYHGGRLYGLTATLERMDGAHARMEPIFGPLIAEMTTQQAVALGLTSQIHVEWLPIRNGPDLSMIHDPVKKRRLGIWQNVVRNRAFAEHYRQFNANASQVLFLTDTIEHAVYLRAELPEFEICTGAWTSDMDRRVQQWKSRGLLPPDFKPVDATHRERIRREFEAGTCKRVIANDIWSTGVSFDSLPFLYRTDSRESFILDTQATGRVGRIAADKDEGRVIDGLDLWDKGFRRKSTARKGHYEQQGYKQSGWVTQ